jgi:RimJ/RimL family protein N-acetyltransferase
MTMPQSAIVLETTRLVLRPHVREDFDDCHAMWSDPEVIRYIGGKPFSREEVWSRLLRYAGHWALLGFGYWVVREKLTGRFLGEVGFADFRREIEPPLDGTPEIGWALAPAAHGHGYASEAVGAAVRWADARWPGGRTVCIIAPENGASLRVAQKNGYVEQVRTTYKGKATIMFQRLALLRDA